MYTYSKKYLKNMPMDLNMKYNLIFIKSSDNIISKTKHLLIYNPYIYICSIKLQFRNVRLYKYNEKELDSNKLNDISRSISFFLFL